MIPLSTVLKFPCVYCCSPLTFINPLFLPSKFGDEHSEEPPIRSILSMTFIIRAEFGVSPDLETAPRTKSCSSEMKC